MKSGIQNLLDFLIYVTSGLTVSIIWYFLQRSITKWMKLKKKILVSVSLAGLILAAFAPVFFVIYSWRWGGPFFTDHHLMIILCSLAAQVAFGVSLYGLIRRGVTPAKEYDEEPLNVQASGRRSIHVRRLLAGNLNNPFDPIHLSWSTFYDGVEFLLEQISTYPHALAIDLFVGINDIGTTMASILAAAQGTPLSEPVEFVGGKNRKYRFFRKPALAQKKAQSDDCQTKKTKKSKNFLDPKTILIADFKIKRGGAIKDVSEFLRMKYGDNINIKFAVFVAPLVSLSPAMKDVDMMTVIRHNEFHRQNPHFAPNFQLPDFLAFISNNEVRLPHNIR